MMIDTNRSFFELANEYGYKSSSYSHILQFKYSECRENLVSPSVELLPGYTLARALKESLGNNSIIRIAKSRRQPNGYTMSIWFSGYSNYVFKFSAKIEHGNLQQVFFQLAENLRNQRIVQVPNILTIKKDLNDYSTLELLEEIERRYKNDFPGWASAILENKEPASVVKIRA